jgi:protocatechuate 3,4-dioxygenase alpha subunit
MSLPPTPSQTAGPYFSFGLCIVPQNEVVSGGDVHVTGQILDGNGEPVSDAMVEIWQADPDGEYRPDFGWARCGSDGEGRFSFVTVKPGCVAGPDGTPQAPHLTALVFARGLLKPVLTRMYFPDEAEANDADRVLSAVSAVDRATLVAEPDGDGLRFDVRLQGNGQTVFFTL